MSRSGYVDDFDDPLELGRYRGIVASVIRSKRGQAFLRELAAAMDAMPVKELIANELVSEEGDCCAIGVVCKARGIDVSNVDPHDPDSVGNLVGIASQMAAEIEFQNDEMDMPVYEHGRFVRDESPAERWVRMRKWVERKLKTT